MHLIKATLNNSHWASQILYMFPSLHFSSFSFLYEKIKIKHPSPIFHFFYKVCILDRGVQILFQKSTERMKFLKSLIIHSGI